MIYCRASSFVSLRVSSEVIGISFGAMLCYVLCIKFYDLSSALKSQNMELGGIARIILLVSLAFLCACSSKKTTPELADAFAFELERLPSVLSGVKDKKSAEAAVEEIHQMRDAIALIVQQVPAEQYLTLDQRIIIEKKVRATQGETAFLLQKLSNQPEVVIALSEPLAELGNVIEAASRVMKGK